jgi:hypothetical protein
MTLPSYDNFNDFKKYITNPLLRFYKPKDNIAIYLEPMSVNPIVSYDLKQYQNGVSLIYNYQKIGNKIFLFYVNNSSFFIYQFDAKDEFLLENFDIYSTLLIEDVHIITITDNNGIIWINLDTLDSLKQQAEDMVKISSEYSREVQFYTGTPDFLEKIQQEEVVM